MDFLSRMALAGALGLVICSPVMAADYDPILVQQAPEVPVEVGTGWYLRGDVGYDLNKSFKDVDFTSTSASYSNHETQFTGSIGVGYHFTDWLRADLNLGYLPGNRVNLSYNDGTIDAAGRIENSAWYGMANAYVDLGTYVGFTPYIGAGAGVLRSEPKASAQYTDANGTLSASYHSPNYSFAYALDAGLSYQMSRNVSLDLGYQYLSAPDAKVAAFDDTDGFRIKKGIHYHQIRVGLRYDLW
jgi:opacity protein-like surface antigen